MLITGCALASQPQRISPILGRLQREGCQLDAYAVSRLAIQCLQNKQPDAALRLFFVRSGHRALGLWALGFRFRLNPWGFGP